MASEHKYVVGAGVALERAVAAWQEALPEVQVRPVALTQDAAYAFDLSVLDALVRKDATAFVVWGVQFLNLRRFELMAALKARGLRMPPFIHRSAVVPRSAQVGENCWIGAGALLGEDVRLGYNSVVGAGANLDAGCEIGHSAWLAGGVQLGEGVRLGAHATLGAGVVVAEGVQIGQFCVLDKPGLWRRDLPARTFVQPGFDTPIETVG